MNRVEKYFLITITLIAVWAGLSIFNLRSCSWAQSDASIRFLLIGDPQIEGNVAWDKKSDLAKAMVTLNDKYMKYIVSSLVESLHPNYVAVMGDLFSYQGTTDDEFDERLVRYKDIFDSAIQNSVIINITGNHDIGYADELSSKLLNRFEKSFGSSNFHFHIPLNLDLNNDSKPDVATVGIINNLLMDPSRDRDIQYNVWSFSGKLAYMKSSRPQDPFILLCHIPLHKPVGCVDKPYTRMSSSGFVDKQNHLSAFSTRYLLDDVQPDIVLTGHDHHGCIYNHTNKHEKSIMEYTIRSIMGDFSGTGALLEIYNNNGTWSHSFNYCYFAPLRLITTTTAIFISLLLLFCLYLLIAKCLIKCIVKS